MWKIIDQGRKVYLGFTGLWRFFDEEQPQLLYGLLEEHTKKGYAGEAAKAIVDYAFSLGFPYLTAACDAPHRTSRRVAERLGMQFVEEQQMNGKPIAFYRLEKR